MIITEDTTVGEVASSVPASLRIFERHGIDYCCGGKTALGTACRDRGLSFEALANAIEASTAVTAPAARDWAVEPLSALADHIVATHHDWLREELPRLTALADKVCGAHGARAPFLRRVAAIVADLAADLGLHMQTEERVLFPAIASLERGGPDAAISGPVAVMEDDHDHAGALLAELRAITGDYVVPAWGCRSVQALYLGLRELESDMHLHVHLENNILFPRALALAGAPADRKTPPSAVRSLRRG
jgi:regulator of cell morphogenesis and NO signaling